MSQTNPDEFVPLQTLDELMPVAAFKAVVWTGFGLCVSSFAVRCYIRFVCFRRLLLEDYLMLVALALISTTSVACQLYIDDIYYMMAVANFRRQPGPDFVESVHRGLRGMLIQAVLGLIAIWLVKFNFLLFFYRLGENVLKYRLFWWAVTFTTAACGAVALGVVKYECLDNTTENIFGYCHSVEAIRSEYASSIVSCTVDVLSDILILIFPITILWNLRVSLRKKIILCSVFSVIVFTIAAAIVRGSIFGGVYKSIDEDNLTSLNITWVWFWLALECLVSFIAACLISFRALFTYKEQRSSDRIVQERQQQPRDSTRSSKSSPMRERVRRAQESLLSTFMSWEGVDSSVEMSVLPHPASGRMSVDFSEGDSWNQSSAATTAVKGSAHGTTVSKGSYESTRELCGPCIVNASDAA